MTLFNDLWKKLKENPSTVPNARSKADKEDESQLVKTEKSSTAPAKTSTAPTPAKAPRTTEQVLNDFQHAEIESLEQNTLFSKLKILKEIVDQPKEETPELRFTQIKQHLGPSESHETVRQERWDKDIHCPNCQSVNLKRLPQIQSKSPHNHRYECLNCGNIFNDDSDTPMEQGVPPLNIWMQCWYLLGCTDSVNYIAHKLGLDLAMVEMMVDRLQKAFHAQKPLTRFIGFDEWSKQSQHLRAQLKEDLLREYELLNANVATAPKDTAEFRRQQNIRRELTPSVLPPSPTAGGRKR